MKPIARSSTIWSWCVSAVFLFTLPLFSFAQTSTDELEEQIESRSDQIEQINQEIEEFQGELEATNQERNTLESTIDDITTSMRSLENEISQTQTQITITEQEIAEIRRQIQAAENELERQRDSLANAIKALQISNSQTVVENLLSADSFAEAYQRSDQLGQIQAGVRRQVERTQQTRQQLAQNREEVEAQMSELAALRDQLSQRQGTLAIRRQSQNELLSAADAQAGVYQSIIAQKREQKQIFERELQEFESQLQSSVSDETVEAKDSTQFSWPVSTVRITQQFGGTEFAARNPSAYGRPFHNGTDFGIPVGTPIMSVAPGTVRASGNTDAISGCYSYGKWILVDHPSGLSTLYAHNSAINARAGQSVARGEVIAYSGNTGYSTGPHLHLTTYVSDDVRVRPLGEVKTRTNCAAASLPVAPQESYLNSMRYLQN